LNSRLGITLALATLAAAALIHAQDAPFHGQVEPQAPQEEEEAWPMETIGDISVLIVKERYRIYTDHCAYEMPALKTGFEEVMKSLKSRIRSIGMALLDTDAFRDMKQQQVSSTLLGALSAELRDIRLDLEDQDPTLVCPETLQSYRDTTDELLEDFLKRTLAGIRSTAKVLKDRNEQ
jgi:hypothetical protein